jgi:hypothetical protein
MLALRRRAWFIKHIGFETMVESIPAVDSPPPKLAGLVPQVLLSSVQVGSWTLIPAVSVESRATRTLIKPRAQLARTGADGFLL